MSLQPVTIPAPLLIFRDLRVRGFWLSGRSGTAGGAAGRAAQIDAAAAAFASGVLTPPETQSFPLYRWREALEAQAAPLRGRKVLLTP